MPNLSLEATPMNGAKGVGDERALLTAVRDELDVYYAELREFATSDPADVMAKISSIHARLVGLRAGLQRNNGQRATSIRTKEVDPLIDALEFQFKCHSRIITLAEQELKLAGGAH